MGINSEPIRDELARVVSGPVTSDPEALRRFRQDASTFVGEPLAAVAPRDTQEVVALVRWARQRRVALVGRGGGTSLDGESVPPDGSVVVDFSGWTQLVELDTENRLVRVGPGLVNRELHRQLIPNRLFFPPNPGSWTSSTIGGNVATNASGMRSFRYGPTRSWVRGLEAVLGTGEILRLGHRARKSSTGPGLLGFLVGSEGTLGLFTEVTLGLAPLPEERIGIVAPIRSEGQLPDLLQRLLGAPELGLAAVEYLDAATASALGDEPGVRLPRGVPLLLLEVECSTSRRDAAIERTYQLLEMEGSAAAAEVFPSADELWTLRGRSSDAISRTHGTRLREDVAVPLSRIPEMLREIREISTSTGVEVYLYGHLGDGSLHPNFAVDPGSALGQNIRRRLLFASRRMGGTISAEHGIGKAKAPFLTLEHGSSGVALLKRIKQACDPDGILNPGKLYPEEGATATGEPSAP